MYVKAVLATLLALAAATTCRASGDPTESLAGVHDLSEPHPSSASCFSIWRLLCTVRCLAGA
jgi:hypothetical protein